VFVKVCARGCMRVKVLVIACVRVPATAAR
jgi:hypothetical protein